MTSTTNTTNMTANNLNKLNEKERKMVATLVALSAVADKLAKVDKKYAVLSNVSLRMAELKCSGMESDQVISKLHDEGMITTEIFHEVLKMSN